MTNIHVLTEAERAAILRRNRRRWLADRLQTAALAALCAALLAACFYAATHVTGEPWAVGDYATAPANQEGNEP